MAAELKTSDTDDRSARLAHAFRAALSAMSEPARPVEIAPTRPPIPGASPAATALVSILVDADAPLWLAEPLRAEATVAAVRFETSSSPASKPEDAAFLLGRWTDIAPHLDRVAIGDAERPDRSATLIVEVDGFDAGRAIEASGPGIDGARRFEVAGAPDDFWTFAARNVARFPLGADIYLTAGPYLLGLPRTTQTRLIGDA